VERYRQRISGPLLDRIDIHVEVPAVDFKELSSRENAEPSAAIRGRVETARAIQQNRFASKAGTTCNARMSSRQLKVHCGLSDESTELLKMAMSSLHLSARAYDRILKVARTIADLGASESIGTEHISEAIQYRTLDRNLWA
jgi:magnesium chelatase family protein